jgi:hypothetical protein
MPVAKLSIALDEDVAAAARRAAERAGMSMSSWLSRAAAHAARIEDGLQAVDEWELEHGSLTGAELAAADQVLDDAQAAHPTVL